ncbi:MAG TPA: hypothetical protein VFJ82_13725 [Longimicrobium sp.]|nr:hypothetical protein [Longimicrobium sp.]
MVIFTATAALFVVYLIPLFLRRARAEREGRPVDMFSPELFLSGYGILGLIYLFLLGIDPVGNRSTDLQFIPWVRDLDVTVMRYLVVMGAGYLATLAGVHSRAAGWFAGRMPMLHARRFTPGRVTRAVVLGGGAGVALYLWFLSSIGGLLNLWAHMWMRTRLMQGKGYTANLYALLLTLTAGMAVYSLRHRPGRLRTALVSLVVLGMAVAMGSTGGRSPVLTVLVLAMLMHHYSVRRRTRLITPLTATLGSVVFVFLLAAPLFRSGGSWEKYSGQPDVLVSDALSDLAASAHGFSSFDRGSVVVNYFTLERVWWGSSYVDLLAAPIPRTLFPDKPPVDDGIYLREIAEGRVVRPSRPAREMNPESWPTGNFLAYMNFWFPGFVIAGFLVGIVTGGTYRYMERTDYAPSAVFIYQYTVMGGVSVSVYGIVNVLITAIIVGGYFWFFFAPKWPGPLPRSVPSEGAAALA